MIFDLWKLNDQKEKGQKWKMLQWKVWEFKGLKLLTPSKGVFINVCWSGSSSSTFFSFASRACLDCEQCAIMCANYRGALAPPAY